MQESGLARYLRGKQLEGTSSPVESVTRWATKRTIRFEDGTKQVVSKRRLVKLFNAHLQKSQAKLSIKSVREMKDGTATALIGGKIKGARKKYVNTAGARKAIRRAYPEAFKSSKRQ